MICEYRCFQRSPHVFWNIILDYPTRKQVANTAIHLSRHRKVIFFDVHTLRPGDGKRYPYPASR